LITAHRRVRNGVSCKGKILPHEFVTPLWLLHKDGCGRRLSRGGLEKLPDIVRAQEPVINADVIQLAEPMISVLRGGFVMADNPIGRAGLVSHRRDIRQDLLAVAKNAVRSPGTIINHDVMFPNADDRLGRELRGEKPDPLSLAPEQPMGLIQRGDNSRIGAGGSWRAFDPETEAEGILIIEIDRCIGQNIVVMSRGVPVEVQRPANAAGYPLRIIRGKIDEAGRVPVARRVGGARTRFFRRTSNAQSTHW